MAATIPSKAWTGHNALSLSPYLLLHLSHQYAPPLSHEDQHVSNNHRRNSSSSISSVRAPRQKTPSAMADEDEYFLSKNQDRLSNQKVTTLVDHDARTMLSDNQNKNVGKLFDTFSLSFKEGGEPNLPLASSTNATDDVDNRGAIWDSTLEEVKKNLVPSSKGHNLFRNNDHEAPVSDTGDALSNVLDESQACNDQIEMNDGGTNAVCQNSDLESSATSGLDIFIDSFNYWDATNDRPTRDEALSNNPRAQLIDQGLADAYHGAIVLANNNGDAPGLPVHNEEITTVPSTDLVHAEDSDSEPSLPAQSDPLIDSLTSRVNENLIIRDAAVQVPNTVTVPKGFVLTESITTDQHHRHHSLLKRRRDETLAEPTSRPTIEEHYGFQSDKINSSGAISAPNCKFSNLSNEIHPFLSRSRFDDTPDAIYDQIVPALRLASMFLTQPACMQYWVTMAFGERKFDFETTLLYRKYCFRIGDHVQMTDYNITKVSAELENLANANMIHFAFRHNNAMPIPNVWACTGRIREYADERKALTGSTIKLNADYYTVAEKLSRLKYPEPSQVLRFSFNLAVIILHELAHSIDMAYYKNRRWGRRGICRFPLRFEPFFKDFKKPECGRVLEITMFGGEIQPINKRVDGSHGICTSDWPPRSPNDATTQRVWYAIPMDYIQSLFLMETWNKKSHLCDYTTFHIPRTGATSACIASCTTMSWFKSDEAAEAFAFAKAQPACKKRLIATGEGEEQRLKEEQVISSFLDRMQAIKMEKASRRLQESRSRRHSFHAADAEEGPQQPKKRLRRAWSISGNDISPDLTRDEREAIANDLRRSFQALRDSLPAHDTKKECVDKAPTYQIVRTLRTRPWKRAHPNLSPASTPLLIPKWSGGRTKTPPRLEDDGKSKVESNVQ